MRRGHLNVGEKNRDDNGLLLEPGKNLQSYKIFWIVQSRDAAFVGHLDPLSSDEDEEDARFRHAMIDGVDEILSRLDSIDVHKNIMLAVFRRQTIIDAPRVGCRILASVAYKD